MPQLVILIKFPRGHIPGNPVSTTPVYFTVYSRRLFSGVLPLSLTVHVFLALVFTRPLYVHEVDVTFS